MTHYTSVRPRIYPLQIPNVASVVVRTDVPSRSHGDPQYTLYGKDQKRPPPKTDVAPRTTMDITQPISKSSLSPEEMKERDLKNNLIKDSRTFFSLTEEEKTEELCSLYLKLRPGDIASIPAKKQTLRLLLETIEKHPLLLYKFSDDLIFKNLHIILLRLNNIDISNLSLFDKVTPGAALCVLHQNINLYADLPFKIRENEILVNFILFRGYQHYSHVPPLALETWCMKNVKAISTLPLPFVTERLCLRLVREDPSNLEYIPEHAKTMHVCTEAFIHHFKKLETSLPSDARALFNEAIITPLKKYNIQNN